MAKCPYINDPVMKNICNIGRAFLTHGNPIDIIKNEDYIDAENLCKKCDAFRPESN